VCLFVRCVFFSFFVAITLPTWHVFLELDGFISWFAGKKKKEKEWTEVKARTSLLGKTLDSLREQVSEYAKEKGLDEDDADLIVGQWGKWKHGQRFSFHRDRRLV
jgi:hypothetical protein